MDSDFYDVVIYGGTSAGIAAAVQAARLGLRPVVIEAGSRIGGMTTCGLSDTDAGNECAIGGLAAEFYHRVGRKYGRTQPEWMFEPKVALEVMHDWVEEHGIPVLHGERIALNGGVKKRDREIVSLRMESGRIVRGRVFIDASYEGDLLAGAGVSYIVGRESNIKFGETENGIRSENELPPGISPYRQPGDPSSGLLFRVNPDAGGMPGSGDGKLQAYNFRMCLTDDPGNRVPIAKPEGYCEDDFEILFRAIEKGQTRRFFKFRMLPNRKSDSNNDSGISTDYIGMNHDYAEADYATRAKILEAHKTYQLGLVWTVQNHPRVPQEIREHYLPWGLPLDEFVDSGHWPPQLYIRESRRMVSNYVISENTVLLREAVEDSIGLGSYAMDSHHTQYCVGEDGFLRTEGGFYTTFEKPYPISYRAIVPKVHECINLLVPVCVSATHAAYGSVRMEPVFMILGQSATMAAWLAIQTGSAVQNISSMQLRAKLLEAGQILGDPNEVPDVCQASQPQLQPLR